MKNKAPIPTEHAEQVTFLAEFKRLYPKIRIFAIPNGGLRNLIVAQKLKAEGVQKGVPDLFIPKWNLWVEMKRTKGGYLSKDQKDWIYYLKSECGHGAIVAKGWEDGINQIISFLD